MSYPAYTWSLDGITFNTRTRDADGILWYLTEDSDPIASPAPTSQYTPRFNRHGSFRIPGYRDRGIQTITVRGYARKGDVPGRDKAMLKLLGICQDPNTLYPLVWNSAYGQFFQNVCLDGEILIKPINTGEPGFEASLQLTSPDPRRYPTAFDTLATGIPQNSITGLDFQNNDLVVNPFFPVNTTGWTAQNSATLSVGSDANGPYGQVTGTLGTGNNGMITTAAVTGLTAGTVYDFYTRVWSATNTGYTITIQWRTAANANLTASTITLSGATLSAWNDIRQSVTAPATTDNALITIRATGTMTAGQSFRVASIFFGVNGTSLDFDASTGLDFGPAAAQGTLIINNTGTAPSAPVITFYGLLVTPVLTTATGSIKYNGTINAGEFVVINPQDPSVLLNGTSPSGFRVDPGQWDSFVVQPGGSLTMGLSHSGSASDGGYVSIQWRPAFW